MADPYISELKYFGASSLDFIEIAVDAGTSVADLVVTVYKSNGAVRTTNAMSGLTKTGTVAGKDIYVIESGSPASFNGLGKTNAVSLSDSSGVYQFVSFSDSPATVTATAGAANGMTSDEIGQAGSGESLETSDAGATYDVQSTPTEGTIPCLVAGSLITTPDGPRRVETLEIGDLVTVLDGPPQPVRWLLRRRFDSEQMASNPHLRPVRICKGAMGRGLPDDDLWVSRQHRMLAQSPIVGRMFDQPWVLIAAHHLVDDKTIWVDTDQSEVTYVHLVFDTYQVVFANGAPTESMHLGKNALATMPKAARRELFTIFPELSENADGMPLPDMIPIGRKQRRLVQRHRANAKPLLSSFMANRENADLD